LRLYRNDWRSLDDIRFELDLLDHLHSSGCAVAYPLATTNGTLHTSISYPEGSRQAALFSYAQGNAPGTELSPPQTQILGKTVAQIHVTADQFSPTGTRQEMDLEYETLQKDRQALIDEQKSLTEKDMLSCTKTTSIPQSAYLL